MIRLALLQHENKRNLNNEENDIQSAPSTTTLAKLTRLVTCNNLDEVDKAVAFHHLLCDELALPYAAVKPQPFPGASYTLFIPAACSDLLSFSMSERNHNDEENDIQSAPSTSILDRANKACYL